MSHEFIELEQATLAVFDILKTISELRHTKVAVIGGMALWKYLPEYRTTQDVDFCITAIGAPGTVKAKLLNLPKSPFKQAADVFMYVQGKQQIQIDFVNTMQLLYLSAAAVEVKDIPAGSVPYISVADLVVYKSFSCGLRPTDQKGTRDADDAWSLLNGEQEELQLSAEHKSIIKPFMLEDVIKYGSDETDAAWWNSKLGL